MRAKKSERTQRLIELSVLKKELAAKRLRQSSVQFEQHDQLLKQLQDYSQEYQQRFHAQGELGMTLFQSNIYHTFLNHLHDAKEGQQQQVQVLQGQLQRDMQYWLQLEQTIESLKKKKRLERRQEEKKQQKKRT